MLLLLLSLVFFCLVQLLATGSEDGMLPIRRVHDLQVVQRFEPLLSAITSLAFSVDEEYIFAGTATGHLGIFAVKC